MNEKLYASPAFRKTSVSRLESAAQVEREMIEDTGLTLSELNDRIDRAMGIDRHNILQHPAVRRGMEGK